MGCGKVGASLTEQLYKEGHDITLVDRSSDRLQALTDMYDVMGIVGTVPVIRFREKQVLTMQI